MRMTFIITVTTLMGILTNYIKILTNLSKVTNFYFLASNFGFDLKSFRISLVLLFNSQKDILILNFNLISMLILIRLALLLIFESLFIWFKLWLNNILVIEDLFLHLVWFNLVELMLVFLGHYYPRFSYDKIVKGITYETFPLSLVFRHHFNNSGIVVF